MEIIWSLKYIFYGFACFNKYKFIDNKEMISPCKINQDVCEHHFANIRRHCFSHAAPTKIEAISWMVKLIFIRMEYFQKSNCGMTKEIDHNTT